MVHTCRKGAAFPRFRVLPGPWSLSSRQGARSHPGMLQELVANQGDGWTWSLEELRLYYEAHAVEPAPPAIIEAGKRPIPVALRGAAA